MPTARYPMNLIVLNLREKQLRHKNNYIKASGAALTSTFSEFYRLGYFSFQFSWAESEGGNSDK